MKLILSVGVVEGDLKKVGILILFFFLVMKVVWFCFIFILCVSVIYLICVLEYNKGIGWDELIIKYDWSSNKFRLEGLGGFLFFEIILDRELWS